MPIGLITGTIQYITVAWDKSGAEPVETKTETTIQASVKEGVTRNTGNYPGNNIKLTKVIIEDWPNTPDVENDRIKWNNKEFKIVGYSQSIWCPGHIDLDCELIRTIT
jgi:hypothetical protein